MTAYEELKQWCEKHLDNEDFTALPETSSFLPTIYFKCDGEITYICFQSNEAYNGAGAELTDADFHTHVWEYEHEAQKI